MQHKILLTGASGYLGGSILAQWAETKLPAYSKLYALVRTDGQAEAVRTLGAEALWLDLSSAEKTRETIRSLGITVVIFLIDAAHSTSQIRMIEALAEIQKETGQNVHFLQTSGAKIFSSHAGAPTEQPFYDSDPDLFESSKRQTSSLEIMQSANAANIAITEAGIEHGVQTYIVVPPIVYGEGRGFGNTTSIQTTAVVRAARMAKQVFCVDDGNPIWPVCHVDDNSSLYLEIVRNILQGTDIPHGKAGYYLASTGSIAWKDIYRSMAAALLESGEVETAEVTKASDEDLAIMAKGLGSPKEMVALQLGGLCMFTAKQGKTIGWKPVHAADEILSAASGEVRRILHSLDSN